MAKTMKSTQFTENHKVLSILSKLEQDEIAKKEFSNIIDDQGNQYVDLVMEGGGVLGIALLGYVYVLEQMKIRFLGLGGTSAGSINAMLMAAGGKVYEEKTDWILSALANKNLMDFVDGDDDAKDFVKVLVEKRKKLAMLWKGWQVIDNFTQDYGLNPGNNFQAWIELLLKAKNINNRADLQKQMHTWPGVKIIHRKTKLPYEPKHKLALIAADVTTQSKIEFPLMADLYWSNPDEISPALFVRASMSIPLFFSPLRITNIPSAPAKRVQKLWDDRIRYEGPIPSEVMFIDGGIMSNFPIDIFHDHTKAPSHPTFGVKLGIDRTKPSENKSVFELIGSIFDSARQVHDFDFILRNPDYKHLVTSINTGNHDWLNFNISDEDKIDLFVRGAECADRFLRGFDWPKYYDIRQKGIDMFVSGNIKPAELATHHG